MVKKKTMVKKALPKAQKGISTADSTFYYGDLEYKSKLRGLNANTKPEMDKQFALMDKAKQDRYRQKFKGKPGYDKNGFPIKKSTVKKKG
jgi:hypothetical protein